MAAPSTPVALLFRQLFEKESSTYTYLLADVAHPDKPAVVKSSFPLPSLPPSSFRCSAIERNESPFRSQL
jgi:hypothetical protein